MRHETNGPESGISVAVDVPLENADLYGNGAIDGILLFLSRHRFDRFTQRELASHSEYAEATVRRGVHLLEDNDIVEVRAEGNRKLVSINRDRLRVPDDPFLRIPQEEYQQPVKAAVEELRRELADVVGIVLYGSVARGEADRRSDVDLWVAVREDRAENQRRANEARDELEDRTFHGERYAFQIAVESLASIPTFTDDIGRIVRSGIPVYETETFEELRGTLLTEAEDERPERSH